MESAVGKRGSVMAAEEFTTLPLQFVRAGLVWRQVARTPTKAIYAGSRDGKILEWEVIRVTHRKERTLPGGKILPAGERYPGDASWGTLGFTHNDEQRALEKYNSL